MRFDVLTIFPEALDSYLKSSMMKRAIKHSIVSVNLANIREYSKDKHHAVDGRPFGGGPGMVMKVEPIYRTVKKVLEQSRKIKRKRIVLFSARGKKFTQKDAKRFSRYYDQCILICGRYEGVDERVAKYIADEEISIGDYVLSGGELPALVFIESVSRFIPGFLGKKKSLENIKGSYPTYTRPEKFIPHRRKRSWKVPKVLLSGNHKEIDAWRKTDTV